MTHYIISADETTKTREASTRDEAEQIAKELSDLGLTPQIHERHGQQDTETKPTDTDGGQHEPLDRQIEANKEDGMNQLATQPEPPEPREQNTIATSLIQPVNTSEVVELYERFENLKAQLLNDTDTVDIQGKNHICKSGWRKIATAFNVSIETVSVQRDMNDGVIRYTATARASAPNGKSSISTGIATSTESNFLQPVRDHDVDESDPDIVFVDGKNRRIPDPRAVSEHNIATLAETRAKNRAVSDLVGGGEVSYEEMRA